MKTHTDTTPTTRCIRVRLADDDYRQLGHQAVEDRTSLGAIIREAVQAYLESRQPQNESA